MKIHKSVQIDSDVKLGRGCVVWANTHVRSGVIIGENTTIGENVYVGPGVKIGDNVKIQNLAQLYEPTIIEDGVFIGPSTIITNDKYPRAINADGFRIQFSALNKKVTTIQKGASIGASVIIVSPVDIGSWSLVAAGTVVTKNVKPHSMVSGIPNKFRYWIGTHGSKLNIVGKNLFQCAVTGEIYSEDESGNLQLIKFEKPK